MPDTDVLKKSVTKLDYPEDPRAGVLHFFMPTWGLGMAPDLPPFWSAQRDQVLAGTLYREHIWESAVYIAITKKTSQDWKVDSDVPLRARRAQQLFLELDSGRGWVSGMQRHLQAYLLTGNGGAIEIVRATGASGARILGLVPLDPLRTLRTGDPDVPLLYRDRRGNIHELKDHQCFILSDMPDTSELWYGVGHCAAERAYNKIVTMEGLERYLMEKITGRRPLALHIINGLSKQQIADALSMAQEDAQSKGQTNYMGAAVAAIVDPTATPGLVTIPFAELPDGFDPVEERREAKLAYAAAIGIDPQELDPSLAARGALGTGAQSMVLDDKEKGKGLYAWDKAWAWAVNYNTLDDHTTFTWSENDLRDRAAEQKIRTDRATEVSTLVTATVYTPAQGMQILVDAEQAPQEFLPQDLTPDDDLTDTEKPEGEMSTDMPPVPERIAALAPDDGLPAVPGRIAALGSGDGLPGVPARIAALSNAGGPAVPERIAAPGKESRGLGATLKALADQVDAAEAADLAGDAQLAGALKQLAAVVQAAAAIPPAPPQITVLPAPVHVEPTPAPVVNVHPTPPVVVPAPAVTVKAAETPQPAGEPREYEVIERDREGRVKKWRETPRKE